MSNQESIVNVPLQHLGHLGTSTTLPLSCPQTHAPLPQALAVFWSFWSMPASFATLGRCLTKDVWTIRTFSMTDSFIQHISLIKKVWLPLVTLLCPQKQNCFHPLKIDPLWAAITITCSWKCFHVPLRPNLVMKPLKIKKAQLSASC